MSADSFEGWPACEFFPCVDDPAGLAFEAPGLKFGVRTRAVDAGLNELWPLFLSKTTPRACEPCLLAINPLVETLALLLQNRKP